MKARFTAIVLLLFATTAMAAAKSAQQPKPPDQLAKQTAQKIRHAIEQNRQKYENDPQALYALAKKFVLPHFDFKYMSRLALGRYWRQATPDQRREFTEAFKKLLVHTYADSVLKYSNNKIDWKPVHAGKNDKYVTVRSEVHLQHGSPVPIDYGLYQAHGQWHVYNVTVDGISLVTNYRSSFAKQARRHGMATLIKRVQEKAKAKAKENVRHSS